VLAFTPPATEILAPVFNAAIAAKSAKGVWPAA